MCGSFEEYYIYYSMTNYDIIIMDISLRGGKNSIDLMKEIKTVSEPLHTPILCLTAHVGTKTERMAIEAGADLFISKPVANNVFIKAVLSLLNAAD